MLFGTRGALRPVAVRLRTVPSPEQPRGFATETKNPLYDEEVDEDTYTNIVVRPRPRSSIVRPARADRGARHVRWTGMFRRWTSTS